MEAPHLPHLDSKKEKAIILVSAVLGIVAFALLFRKKGNPDTADGGDYSGYSTGLGDNNMGSWAGSSGTSAFQIDLEKLAISERLGLAQIKADVAKSRGFSYEGDYSNAYTSQMSKGKQSANQWGVNAGATVGNILGSLGFGSKGASNSSSNIGSQSIGYAKSGITVTGFGETDIPLLTQTAQNLAAGDRTLSEKLGTFAYQRERMELAKDDKDIRKLMRQGLL